MEDGNSGLKLNEIDAIISHTKTSFPRARERLSERASEQANECSVRLKIISQTAQSDMLNLKKIGLPSVVAKISRDLT